MPPFFRKNRIMPSYRFLKSGKFIWLCLLAGVILSFAAVYADDPFAGNTSANEKVAVSAALTKVEGQENLLDVTVTFQIQPDWHIYAQLPKDHPSVLTTVKFVTPSSVSSEGKLMAPKSFASPSEPGVFYYQGKAVFRQRFQIESGVHLNDESAIEVQVRYQACTKTQCLPPASKKIKLEIPQ
jgi:hypothetical protein